VRTTVDVIVQKRIPSYDVVIRSNLDCDVVRKSVSEFFEENRRPLRGFVWNDERIDGVFDGENSFVVQSRAGARAFNNMISPVIDGYLLSNDGRGCDILFRVTYPSWAWAVAAVFYAFILVGAISTGGLTIEGLVVAAASLFMFSAIIFLPLWVVGSSFASQMKKLLLAEHAQQGETMVKR
jgi:hypothetical protein